MCVSEPVAVLQAMGRKSGFITAASRLGDPRREMPLQLYMAETHHTLESLHENVNRELRRSGPLHRRGERGLRRRRRGGETRRLRPYRVRRKPDHRVPAGGQLPEHQGAGGARAGNGAASRRHPAGPSPSRRHRGHRGGAAGGARKRCALRMRDGTGWMATILRKPGRRLRPRTMTRCSWRRWPTLPDSCRRTGSRRTAWTSPMTSSATRRRSSGTGFPVIPHRGGLQRFARFDITFIGKKCESYLPVRFRKT